MLLLKFYSHSVTLNMSPPSFPPQERRPGKNLLSLQMHRPPPVGHTHHLIYSGNGPSSLLKQVSSPFQTIHIHPRFIQFLAHFRMHVLIPSLSCIIRKVWHRINSIIPLKSRSRKYTVSFIKKVTSWVWHALGADKATWKSYFSLTFLSNYSFLWILQCD